MQINWSKRPRSRDKELVRLGFNDAPNGLVADKLAKASLAQIDAWSDALPDAESLKQVFAAKKIQDLNDSSRLP